MEFLMPFRPNSVPLTPINFLERAATAYSDCPALVYNNNDDNKNNNATTYTWDQTHQRCVQAASSIKSLGIKQGDVVSVLAPNVPAMYELQFSVPMAGAVVNNINTRLDPRTLSVLLRHSESKLVFVDHHLHPILVRALSLFPPGTPHPIIVVIKDTDDVNINGSNSVASYKQLVDGGNPGFEWIRPKSEWDALALNYTSGTTNNPKGVALSHRGYYILAVDTLLEWSVPKQPVYLWTLPMFHANGWSLTWGMAAVGATNICLRKFDAPIVYEAIQHNRVTHMCGAPVVLNMLANLPNAKPLTKPVHILTAGAPPPASVLFRTESLGFVVSHGYGLTETGGLVVNSAWKSKWDHLPAKERARLKARQGVGSLGMTEVDILDPKTGQPVRRDGSTLGEVVLKGGSVMLGYLKDPEGTSKSMTRTGWFRTGDVGVIHHDGYLEIKDRLKDIIISGGENISSVEVEAVLYTHPAVNEAAVVARPDEFWGETPCAFLSLKMKGENEVTKKEIIEYCRERMAHYMVPKTVVFEEELPKTSTGKVQKFLLREMAKAMGPIKVVSYTTNATTNNVITQMQ
ncbi:probable acyl-activating enzyme 6 [Chenopodium quinoa]|uniref:probable acyl-activating enzyme 6 n=1 Tax=Chenopodium quinoa TaxID=63459 RepID=UPI000B782C68|nr:probable acyl-activating enzyme 6 [Chenopodium quinoa]